MHDDDETRPVRAVRKRIEEQETKLRPAVVRRNSPRLLPTEIAGTTVVRSVERSKLLRTDLSTDTYHFENGALVASAPWRLLFHRWRFDFHDADGKLRFWFERGLRRLLFNQLEVFDANDVLLGRFEQQLSGLEVHFEVFDADGKPRFSLKQPAGTYASYFATFDGAELGRIGPERVEWDGSAKQALTTEDALRIEFNNEADELDRVLLIAGAVFMDRIYSTGKNE